MRIMILTLVILVCGCVPYENIIPEDYTGETAIIYDSFDRVNRGKAYFYYLRQVGDKKIPNALSASAAASYGRGNNLATQGASRLIPIEPLNLLVVGQSYHAAPISSIIDSESGEFDIEGVIQFTPEANQKYIINGELNREGSSIWIEDINGNVVSKALERAGDKNAPIKLTTKTKDAKNRSREEIFLQLSSGTFEEIVVSKLGKPDNLKEIGHFHIAEKNAHIEYVYNDLGKIQFYARNSKPEFVQRIIPNIKLSDDPERVKKHLEMDGEVLRYLAKSYYQYNNPSTEMLDLIAQKVWLERKSKDAFTVDAVAWLCKTIQKSGRGRYKEFMRTLTEESATSKLKKYAKISFESLPQATNENFIP